MKSKKVFKRIIIIAAIVIVVLAALIFIFGGDEEDEYYPDEYSYEDEEDHGYIQGSHRRDDFERDDYDYGYVNHKYDVDEDYDYSEDSYSNDDDYYSYYTDYYGNYSDKSDYQTAASEIFAAADTTVSPAAEVKEGTWTILYYLCGSDLESEGGYASCDIQEIAQASTNSKIKMIAQTGGSKKWQIDGISEKNIERWELANGQAEKVDTQNLASMGSPDTLSGFISWAKENYPAERYMIVFWNHGSGSAYGVCFDELYQPENKNPDSLSVVEMAQGLRDGGITFDIVGYDTCLTATIENDYAIAPYARYVVASEEVEPGEGWNYTDWIGYLCKNPKCSTVDLGKRIVSSYMELCQKNEQEDSATLSLVDLSQVKNVYNAFVSMAAKMSAATSDISVFKNVKKEAKSARYFGTRTVNEGYTNMTDLGDMADNLTEVLGQNVTSPLISSIKSAVIYEQHGSSRSEATGISVYYPVKSTAEELNLVAEATTNGPYLAFIDAMCDYWTAPSWVYSNSSDSKSLRTKNDISVSKSFAPVKSKDYSVKFREYINDEGVYTLQVTSGIDSVDIITFDLMYFWEDNSGCIYLGNDNNIIADWDKGTFSDNFSGYWITMDGEYVNAYLLEEEDDFNIYTAPILLNGKETNLRFKYDFNQEKYSVIGAFDGTDEWGASSRKSRKLQPGDEITFLFDNYIFDNDDNPDNDETKTIENGKIIYSYDSEIKDDALIDGSYYYVYTFYDVFDNEYQTEGVILTVKDGEIFVSNGEE